MSERRSRFFKAAIGLLVILMIALGVAIYKTDRWYRALVADLCGVTVHRVLPAPDIKVALLEFDVSCGATTGFSTQLSLLPGGSDFDRDKYPPFFIVGGRHNLVVQWTNDGKIEIVIPPNEQVYRQELSANGTAVIYK